jgi:hypothetical protein
MSAVPPTMRRTIKTGCSSIEIYSGIVEGQARSTAEVMAKRSPKIAKPRTR